MWPCIPRPWREADRKAPECRGQKPATKERQPQGGGDQDGLITPVSFRLHPAQALDAGHVQNRVAHKPVPVALKRIKAARKPFQSRASELGLRASVWRPPASCVGSRAGGIRSWTVRPSPDRKQSQVARKQKAFARKQRSVARDPQSSAAGPDRLAGKERGRELRYPHVLTLARSFDGAPQAGVIAIDPAIGRLAP